MTTPRDDAAARRETYAHAVEAAARDLAREGLQPRHAVAAAVRIVRRSIAGTKLRPGGRAEIEERVTSYLYPTPDEVAEMFDDESRA